MAFIPSSPRAFVNIRKRRPSVDTPALQCSSPLVSHRLGQAFLIPQPSPCAVESLHMHTWQPHIQQCEGQREGTHHDSEILLTEVLNWHFGNIQAKDFLIALYQSLSVGVGVLFPALWLTHGDFLTSVEIKVIRRCPHWGGFWPMVPRSLSLSVEGLPKGGLAFLKHLDPTNIRQPWMHPNSCSALPTAPVVSPPTASFSLSFTSSHPWQRAFPTSSGSHSA